MAAREPYIVGGITFATKEALAAHTQRILRTYRAGQQLDMFDTPFMLDLLQRHPSAAEKIGVGVVAIYVQHIAFNSNGFVLERTDGSREDFSYKQCIRPFTHASKVKFALRRAIVDQVLTVKAQVFPDRVTVATCPITGQMMTYSDAHVDHEPPDTFAALLQRYLGERGVTLDDIPTFTPATGIGAAIPDEWVRDWCAWHQQHAHLRVISAYANLHLVKG